MFKYYLSAFFLSFLLVFSNLSQADTAFSQVYIFGDSLSDTGNAASVVGDLPPPYYMNRVSNGPVAVEVLAAKLGHTAEASLHFFGAEVGSNYAVAGANAIGDKLEDLSTQIISFQANHGFVAPADALYVIIIGGNDLRDTRKVADLTIAESIVHAAAAEVQHAVENLVQSGARSFLLINAPNIGLIPETRLIASIFNNTELVKRTSKLSKLYRTVLHDMAEQLKVDHDISIVEPDLFKFFNKLVKKADTYGFSNATDACFSTVTLSFHPDCNDGLNIDQFVFIDEIHPTARAHALIGEAFYESLKIK